MFRVRFLIDIVAPALILCWAAIFIYSAAVGQSGFGALSELNREVESRAAAVDALRARRIALEKNANQLASKSLDPDLAEERIRKILGYVRDGDVVVTEAELERALQGK